jgi:hypothetical protein
VATGRKTVVVGQVIDPVVWGNPLWDQSVQCFANDADRTAQYPVAQRHEGAVSWLEDVDALQVWLNGAWANLERTSYGLANYGAGVGPINSNFAGGQVFKTGRMVTFYGAGLLTAGGTGGATVWSVPAGFTPAAGAGAVIVGWCGTAAARFEIAAGSAAITYQAGGTPTAGAIVSAFASWLGT